MYVEGGPPLNHLLLERNTGGFKVQFVLKLALKTALKSLYFTVLKTEFYHINSQGTVEFFCNHLGGGGGKVLLPVTQERYSGEVPGRGLACCQLNSDAVL